MDEVGLSLHTLREAKKRFSAQLAPDFRIFDYLRDDEIGLSRCLADLLNPNGKHGQGSIFLDSFLTLINWQSPINRCKVQVEKQANHQRRIDIYLEFDEGVIGIENKPWAGDQPDQLSDYAKYIKKVAAGGAWQLIYLCNQGPSEESISSELREKLEAEGHFIQLNYDQLACFLEASAAKAKALLVRVYVEELVKFIRQSINGEMDMSESHEALKTIASDVQRLQASFDIANALPKLKQQYIANLKEQLLKINTADTDVVIDQNAQWSNTGAAWWNVSTDDKNTGFTMWLKTNRFGHVALRFAFEFKEYDGFYWGITSFAAKRPHQDAAKSEAIFSLLEPHFDLTKTNKTEHWTCWSWPKAHFTPDWKKNWSKQAAPWIAIQQNQFAKEVFEFAENIRNLLDDSEKV